MVRQSCNTKARPPDLVSPSFLSKSETDLIALDRNTSLFCFFLLRFHQVYFTLASNFGRLIQDRGMRCRTNMEAWDRR